MTLYDLKAKIADKQAAGEDCSQEKMQEAIAMVKLSHQQSLRKFGMDDNAIDRLVDDDAAIEWLLRDINKA